jgi:hypothetical protein
VLTIVGALFGALDAEVPGFELRGHVREDANFQVSPLKNRFAVEVGHNELASPLTGEGEIQLSGDELAAAVQSVVFEDEAKGLDEGASVVGWIASDRTTRKRVARCPL